MTEQDDTYDEASATITPERHPKRAPQQVIPWPATSEELAQLHDEVQRLSRSQQEFRQGMIGSKDFPGGEVLAIKNLISAAAQSAAIASSAAAAAAEIATATATDATNATARLANHVDQMPDEIVAKINGTYVKNKDFIQRVDERIKARSGEGRLAMLSTTTKWFFTVLTFTVVGTITYLVTNVLPHIH